MRVTKQSRLATSAIHLLLQYYQRIQKNFYLGGTIIQLLESFTARELQCYYKHELNFLLSSEQRNWGLNELEYSSGKFLAIRAQPRAQAHSALSSNWLRLSRTIL